jgi:hypothetical protein
MTFSCIQSLPPIPLFWLSIVNDTSADLISNWAWASQVFDFGDGGIARRTGETDPWFLSSAFAQDFTITGPVRIPEPEAIVLLALGLLGLLRYARLRQSYD